MRFLIISDIHANLAAFETVLADAKGEWDKIWCLGDVIGYGPDPNECVALLREQEHLSLSGNHDWAVLGRLDLDTFNEDAQVAIGWTRRVLTEKSRQYLEELPSLLVEEPFTLAHASPRQPVWEYILESMTAAANFDHFQTPYCLVGHTHAPVIYEQSGSAWAEAIAPIYAEPYPLNKVRLIVNPGSVGQPRDYDPRAAYAILDCDKLTLEHRRVAYPIEKTQSRMSEFGLPYRLIARLEFGW
jgi:predicted phosphodiesterase